ncbi:unnamed protein product [Anisakis simplex]|uniref:Apple domain-containing protein n=1 Tax=Anisakis simplex TaxID=6269 RepID=A0A0M3K4L6_ANISI|nr:unnamed protein product [Anisakis simplex]
MLGLLYVHIAFYFTITPDSTLTAEWHGWLKLVQQSSEILVKNLVRMGRGKELIKEKTEEQLECAFDEYPAECGCWSCSESDYKNSSQDCLYYTGTHLIWNDVVAHRFSLCLYADLLK